MYRSLSDRGSFTEYVYVLLVPTPTTLFALQPPQSQSPFLMSSDMPQCSPGGSIPTPQYRGASIRFASATQSDEIRTTSEAPVFLPTGQIHVEFVHENTKDRAAPTSIYEAV